MGEDLFLLIQSLTKEEKRYFKLFAKSLGGKNAKYLQLFDVLEKMASYDEDTLKQWLRGKRWLTQLSTYKKYLYDLILKSLRIQNDDASIDEEILTGLHEVKTLLRKHLVTQALDKLTAIKKNALVFDKIFYLQKINDLELMASNMYGFKNWEPQDLEQLYQEHLHANEAVQEYMEQRYDAVRLFFQMVRQSYYRNISQEADFQECLQRWRQEQKPKGFSAALAYFQKMSAAYAINFDVTEKFYSLRGFVQKIEENKLWLQDSDVLRMYFGGLLRVMRNSPKKETAFFEQCYKKAKQLDGAKLYRGTVVELLEALLFRSVSTGDFETAYKMRDEITQEMDSPSFEEAPLLVKLNIYYFLAITYFIYEQWDKAQFLLAQTQALKHSGFSIIQNSARILELIIYCEKGESLLLESAVRSLLRTLTKHNAALDFERLWLRSLQKITDAPDKKSREKALLSLEKKLKELVAAAQKNATLKEPLIYFDYFVWIKSRLEERPLLEVAKEHWTAFGER